MANAIEPLRPAWSYSVPPGLALSFPAIADEAGNVYWMESSPTGDPNELVSAAPDGTIRGSGSRPEQGEEGLKTGWT